MIFVDSRGHMITNGGIEELHAAADRIGLKREWFQENPRHPHYDLVKRERGKFIPHNEKIAQAIKFGAVLVSTRELVKINRFRRQWQEVASA